MKSRFFLKKVFVFDVYSFSACLSASLYVFYLYAGYPLEGRSLGWTFFDGESLEGGGIYLLA